MDNYGSPGGLMSLIGNDGFIHTMPTGQGHAMDIGCFCDPIQKRDVWGRVILLHRDLAC